MDWARSVAGVALKASARPLTVTSRRDPVLRNAASLTLRQASARTRPQSKGIRRKSRLDYETVIQSFGTYSTPRKNLFDFGRPCARRPASARLPRQSDNSLAL